MENRYREGRTGLDRNPFISGVTIRDQTSVDDVTPTVSVIIPAANEEKHIGKCVNSAYRALLNGPSFEVLVVDDDSTDDTSTIAAEAGADVLQAPTDAATIAAVRNYGVNKSDGSILVFLDADVTVTSRWGDRFRDIAPTLHPPSDIVTGSTCRVPDNPSWIEEYWFRDLRNRSTYIPSGHLIVGRDVFCELGGFDQRLVTGEDHDFCQRAIQRGITVHPDGCLEAIHHGFPKTLKEFVLREIWHGAGDASSLARVRSSKVALSSIVFAMAHILVGTGLVTGSLLALFVGLSGIISLIGTTAIVKQGGLPLASWIRTFLLAYFYYFARSLALVLGALPERWHNGVQ